MHLLRRKFEREAISMGYRQRVSMAGELKSANNVYLSMEIDPVGNSTGASVDGFTGMMIGVVGGCP